MIDMADTLQYLLIGTPIDAAPDSLEVCQIKLLLFEYNRVYLSADITFSWRAIRTGFPYKVIIVLP